MLTEAGDTEDNQIPVAIETDRGLLIAALRSTGRAIYPLNPLAASRYRARHQVSGAKVDATDAVLLANILRTDMAAHRALPADTELAQAIRVLARAQQDAVWARQRLGNQIRSLLTDFYPAALDGFAGLARGGLARPEARTILAAAPTPAKAARLSRGRLRTLLIKAGRQRGIDDETDRLLVVFRGEYLRQLPAVEKNATGIQLAALLVQFDAACRAAEELETAARENFFEQHPDATVISSFPGMGDAARRPGARRNRGRPNTVHRCPRPQSLRRIRTGHPTQRQKKTAITYQRIKNNRLPAVGSIWALSALKASPGAKKRHYQARQERGDWNRQAQRHLFNKFLGQLHHCLHTGASYDETHAFPTPPLG